jgi:nitrite reductase/ring-hydroxylating ferredoxin subunit
MRIRIIIVSTSISLTFLFNACSKKQNSSELILPDSNPIINVTLKLSDKDNEALTYNGGFRIINIESKHILVCRKSETLYWASACDCNASVHSSSIPTLSYIKEMGILKDITCGSEYDAVSGIAVKAPASTALSTYKVSVENGVLKITK